MNLLKKILWLLLAGALVLGVASCDDDDDDDDDDSPSLLFNDSVSGVTAGDVIEAGAYNIYVWSNGALTVKKVTGEGDATTETDIAWGSATEPSGEAGSETTRFTITSVKVEDATKTVKEAKRVSGEIGLKRNETSGLWEFKNDTAKGTMSAFLTALEVEATVVEKLTKPTLTVAAGVVTISNYGALATTASADFDKFQYKIDSGSWADLVVGSATSPALQLTVTGTGASATATFTVAQTAAAQSVTVKAVKKSSSTKADSDPSDAVTVAATTPEKLTKPTLTVAAGVVTISNYGALATTASADFDKFQYKIDSGSWADLVVGSATSPALQLTVTGTGASATATFTVAQTAAAQSVTVKALKKSSSTKADSDPSDAVTVAATTPEKLTKPTLTVAASTGVVTISNYGALATTASADFDKFQYKIDSGSWADLVVGTASAPALELTVTGTGASATATFTVTPTSAAQSVTVKALKKSSSTKADSDPSDAVTVAAEE